MKLDVPEKCSLS